MCWDFFVDLVSVVTQLIAAVVGIIGLLLAWRTFLRTPTQEVEPEPPEVAAQSDVHENVVVFQTKNQTTWLLASGNGLQCYLEDRRPGKSSGMKWSMPKTQVAEVLENQSFHVYPGYKVTTGTFSIGPRRGWLYSKNLYPDPSTLRSMLSEILEKART